MSGFLRTRSGLNNQYLFHNVDVVVYLEGGNFSFTYEEAINNDKYHSETEDIIFWRKIFEEFKPDLKVKFKSIGSKSVVLDIAGDVKEGILTNVIVGMDNEFDEVLKKRQNHPHILYTHGYSWENDVWDNTTLKKVIEELSAITIFHSDIDVLYQEFIRKIKYAVYADGYLFSKGNSFFPKQGRMFCVNCNPIDLPDILLEKIESRLQHKNLKKNTLYHFARRKSIFDVKKFCFGHFLSDYCCQIVKHYLKNRHNLNIDNCVIYRMCINMFFRHSFKNSNVYDYYNQQVARVSS